MRILLLLKLAFDLLCDHLLRPEVLISHENLLFGGFKVRRIIDIVVSWLFLMESLIWEALA